MKAVVYFIEDTVNGSIKIGYSTQPKVRLTQLQVTRPGELRLIAVTPGGKDVEAELHREFSHARIRGEWFRPVPELLARIEGLPCDDPKLLGLRPDPGAHALLARDWVLALEQSWQSEHDCDLQTARHAVAKKIGIGPGFLENVARRRIRKIGADEFDLIRRAYSADVERRLSAMQALLAKVKRSRRPNKHGFIKQAAMHIAKAEEIFLSVA